MKEIKWQGMAPKSFITGNSEDTELIPQKHIISYKALEDKE